MAIFNSLALSLVPLFFYTAFKSIRDRKSNGALSKGIRKLLLTSTFFAAPAAASAGACSQVHDLPWDWSVTPESVLYSGLQQDFLGLFSVRLNYDQPKNACAGPFGLPTQTTVTVAATFETLMASEFDQIAHVANAAVAVHDTSDILVHHVAAGSANQLHTSSGEFQFNTGEGAVFYGGNFYTEASGIQIPGYQYGFAFLQLDASVSDSGTAIYYTAVPLPAGILLLGGALAISFGLGSGRKARK